MQHRQNATSGVVANPIITLLIRISSALLVCSQLAEVVITEPLRSKYLVGVLTAAKVRSKQVLLHRPI